MTQQDKETIFDFCLFFVLFVLNIIIFYFHSPIPWQIYYGIGIFIGPLTLGYILYTEDEDFPIVLGYLLTVIYWPISLLYSVSSIMFFLGMKVHRIQRKLENKL